MDRKEPLGENVCITIEFFKISKGDNEIAIRLSKVSQKPREFTKLNKC